MQTTEVFLNLNGVDECIEVDLEHATVEELATSFGLRNVRRAGSSTVLGMRLPLKSIIVEKNNSEGNRLNVEGARAEGDAESIGRQVVDMSKKVDQILELMRDLNTTDDLRASPEGALSKGRPPRNDLQARRWSGQEPGPALTEEQLEAYLLEGRGISDRGIESITGSMARLPTDGVESPTRSSVRNGAAEINEALNNAQDLFKQLSAERDLSGDIAA